jgi:hypothetical protein
MEVPARRLMRGAKDPGSSRISLPVVNKFMYLIKALAKKEG